MLVQYWAILESLWLVGHSSQGEQSIYTLMKKMGNTSVKMKASHGAASPPKNANKIPAYSI